MSVQAGRLPVERCHCARAAYRSMSSGASRRLFCSRVSGSPCTTCRRQAPSAAPCSGGSWGMVPQKPAACTQTVRRTWPQHQRFVDVRLMTVQYCADGVGVHSAHPSHEWREALPVHRFRCCQRHCTKSAPMESTLYQHYCLHTRSRPCAGLQAFRARLASSVLGNPHNKQLVLRNEHSAGRGGISHRTR